MPMVMVFWMYWNETQTGMASRITKIQILMAMESLMNWMMMMIMMESWIEMKIWMVMESLHSMVSSRRFLSIA